MAYLQAKPVIKSEVASHSCESEQNYTLFLRIA